MFIPLPYFINDIHKHIYLVVRIRRLLFINGDLYAIRHPPRRVSLYPILQQQQQLTTTTTTTTHHQ